VGVLSLPCLRWKFAPSCPQKTICRVCALCHILFAQDCLPLILFLCRVTNGKVWAPETRGPWPIQGNGAQARADQGSRCSVKTTKNPGMGHLALACSRSSFTRAGVRKLRKTHGPTPSIGLFHEHDAALLLVIRVLRHVRRLNMRGAAIRGDFLL